MFVSVLNAHQIYSVFVSITDQNSKLCSLCSSTMNRGYKREQELVGSKAVAAVAQSEQ